MATEDIRLTFGALMIGCMISIGYVFSMLAQDITDSHLRYSLSGMASIQAYMYYRNYKSRDTTGLKATVCFKSQWSGLAYTY